MKIHELNNTHWAEVSVVLTPSDFMKAARLGGLHIEDEDILTLWDNLLNDPQMRKDYADTVAWFYQVLLDEFAFQAVFRHPSPFTNDKNR